MSASAREIVMRRRALDEAGFGVATKPSAEPGAPLPLNLGHHLGAATDGMNVGGWIALCGSIAQYDSDDYGARPSNFFTAIENRLTLTGFNPGLYAQRAPEYIALLAQRLQAGEPAWRETIVNAVNSLIPALCAMLGGGNAGKMLVRLD